MSRLRRHLDLRDRVTLASVAALGVGLALLTIGINVLLGQRLDTDVSAVLRERADAQIATLAFGPGGRVTVRDAPNDEALDRQAWIYGPGGAAIQRPPAPPDVQRAADRLAKTSHGVERDIPEQFRLRVERAFDTRGRRTGTVVVGVSLRPYEHTERIVLVATLLVDAFVLLAGGLLVRWAVTKALRPVADMTARAAEWSEHDLDRRFNLGPPHDELTALSATLDGLLARIASSLRHEQRFSAEIAHELRTPLAGVRGEAELALLRPGLQADMREGLEQILLGTERMATVIETLLTAARSAAHGAPGASLAAAAADAVASALRPAAAREGIDLVVRPDPAGVRVGADEDVVAQTLHPLIDNAVRHAHTLVSVGIERVNGAVVFSVRDDGAGVDPESASHLFEPGRSTEGGAGLGLPLARRLARSCGGDVEVVLGSSRPGGYFMLLLPAIG